jgi:hypothetical protein
MCGRSPLAELRVLGAIGAEGGAGWGAGGELDRSACSERLQRSVTGYIQVNSWATSAEPHTAETVRAGRPCALNPDSRLRREADAAGLAHS